MRHSNNLSHGVTGESNVRQVITYHTVLQEKATETQVITYHTLLQEKATETGNNLSHGVTGESNVRHNNNLSHGVTGESNGDNTVAYRRKHRVIIITYHTVLQEKATET